MAAVCGARAAQAIASRGLPGSALLCRVRRLCHHGARSRADQRLLRAASEGHTTMSETISCVVIRPVKGRFGAEILGLDLSRGLAESEFRRIEQAWFDASFLVFRDLVMTPEQHIELTRRFGALHIMTPLHYNHPDHAEVLVLTNLEEG